MDEQRQQASGLPDLQPTENKVRVVEAALLARLQDPKILNSIIEPVIEKAQQGSLRAFTIIRDSIGEKPAPSRPQPDQNINVTINGQPISDGGGYAD